MSDTVTSTSSADRALGVDNQTGALTDVLLGRPDHFRWVPLNSISAVRILENEAQVQQLAARIRTPLSSPGSSRASSWSCGKARTTFANRETDSDPR